MQAGQPRSLFRFYPVFCLFKQSPIHTTKTMSFFDLVSRAWIQTLNLSDVSMFQYHNTHVNRECLIRLGYTQVQQTEVVYYGKPERWTMQDRYSAIFLPFQNTHRNRRNCYHIASFKRHQKIVEARLTKVKQQIC